MDIQEFFKQAKIIVLPGSGAYTTGCLGPFWNGCGHGLLQAGDGMQHPCGSGYGFGAGSGFGKAYGLGYGYG